jgi:tRNA(Arg) A34 adenosine deaminase TadA
MKKVDNIAKNWTIIYKGGKILVAKPCCNLGGPTNYICRKTNVTNNYITRHSEVQALACIRKIKKRKIYNITIINVRFSREGQITNSKCCRLCAKVLYRFGVKNIIYSTEEGKFVKEKIDKIMETALLSKGSLPSKRNILY